MVYGNNGDRYSLRATGTGVLMLKRVGLDVYCPFQKGEDCFCGDWCAAFHRRYTDSLMLVDLCCMPRETTIKIEKE